MHERSTPSLGDLDQIDLGSNDHSARLPPDPGNRARKPWLALLLAIVCSPAAFAYVGRYAWCIGLAIVLVAVAAALSWTGALQSFVGVWAFIVFGLVQTLACIVLPWWFARKQQRSYRLRWYNRWYLYPFLVIAVSLPMLLLFGNREQVFGYATFRIPSGSMAPTVGVGDLIIADARASTLASLHVGDVVVNESNTRPGELNLRRIVATGGQHVVIDGKGVMVDGVLQLHTHQQGDDLMDSRWMQFADVELEPDQLYLMGDNRGNSFDSRTEGPYTHAQIRAKATAIWLSSDASRLGALPTP